MAIKVDCSFCYIYSVVVDSGHPSYALNFSGIDSSGLMALIIEHLPLQAAAHWLRVMVEHSTMLVLFDQIQELEKMKMISI